MENWKTHPSFILKIKKETPCVPKSLVFALLTPTKVLLVKNYLPFKPQIHIHDFPQGRATIHPALSICDASA